MESRSIWSKWHLVILAVLATVGFITLGYIGVAAVGQAPPVSIGHTTQVIAPNEGVAGFNVDTFCEKTSTDIKLFPAPDVSGTTYQLTNNTGGIAETVVAIIAADRSVKVATHYYQSNDGQQSEMASLTPEATACILRKAK